MLYSKPKPIKRAQYGVVSRRNIPNDGPIVPRLRNEIRTEAVGFTHSFVESEPMLVEWSNGSASIDWTKGDK